MKTKNFPAKKLLRQIRAKNRKGEAVDNFDALMLNARGVRTKKRR